MRAQPVRHEVVALLPMCPGRTQFWTGGRSEIRTHGTLAGTPVFKTGALNHSATLPNQ
jgi:hypothetical protein